MAHFEPKPFGKYFLIEKIAVGGMAEIFKAKTFGVDGFEKILAIKKILPHYSSDKEFISMLTDEAKLVVKLSHTNIVQIYDLGKIAEDYYISMEFIDGVNLREVINRGKKLKDGIPLPLCLYIGSEICKGLDYAHSKRDDHGQPLNIVHRDISPQNILISFEGESKIVDFGIAKAAMNVSHTTEGILKGKVTYMSPEQALGQGIDYRTDIFSLGIILYELITGERLFMGDSQLEILKKIRQTQLNADFFKGKIPDELIPVLCKALAYDKAERYQSAGDFQIALTKILYSKYPDFSPKQLSELIKKWFAIELKMRKKMALDEASIKSNAKNLIINYKGKSIVEKSVKSSKGLIQETTKPDDHILPDHLVHSTAPEGEIIAEHLDHDERRVLAHEDDDTTPIHRPTPPFKKIIFLMTLFFCFILIGGGATLYFLKPNLYRQISAAFSNTGLVEVMSTPSGAWIYLDGRSTGELTPVELKNIKVGKVYKLKVELSGYQKWERDFSVNSTDKIIIQAFLDKVPSGIISLRSNPEGAKIYINGDDTGFETPHTFNNLTIGETYLIQLNKDGYALAEQNIDLLDAKPLQLNYELKKEVVYSKLDISSQPLGAKVYINNEDTGLTTPTQINDLEINTKLSIRLEHPGYEPRQEDVTIAQNIPYSLSMTLNPLPKKEEPEMKAEAEKEADKKKEEKKTEEKVVEVKKEEPKKEVPVAPVLDKKEEVKPTKKAEVEKDDTIESEENLEKIPVAPKKKNSPFSPTVTILSQPSDATILINKNEIGQTPKTIQVPAGKSEVIIEKEGFKTFTKFFQLGSREQRKIYAVLQKDKSSRSKKEKAQEMDIALTPENNETEGGEPLSMAKEKKKKSEATPLNTQKIPDLVLEQSQEKNAGTYSVRLGSLRVDSNPRGAFVQIDGKKAGITPVVIPKVDPNQKHTVTLTYPGYHTWSRTVELSNRNYDEIMVPMTKE